MKKTHAKVVAAPKPSPEEPKTILSRSTKERKGSSVVFLIPGVRGSVKIARSAFETVPDALVVVGRPFVAPVVRLTKEERAARRKAMTPKEKAAAARARAERALRLAAKLEAALR